MSRVHDIAVHDVLYEKEIQPSMSISFMNGSEITSIPSRNHAHELMIDEITLTLSVNEHLGKMLNELRQHMVKQHGTMNIEYQMDKRNFIDFRNSIIRYPSPEYTVVTIEAGGIPYGFLSRYKKQIASLDMIFVKRNNRHLEPIGTHIRGRSSYNGYVAYTQSMNVFPFPKNNFYLDREMKQPFLDVFLPKTNKEAKKQARLELVED